MSLLKPLVDLVHGLRKRTAKADLETTLYVRVNDKGRVITASPEEVSAYLRSSSSIEFPTVCVNTKCRCKPDTYEANI